MVVTDSECAGMMSEENKNRTRRGGSIRTRGTICAGCSTYRDIAAQDPATVRPFRHGLKNTRNQHAAGGGAIGAVVNVNIFRVGAQQHAHGELGLFLGEHGAREQGGEQQCRHSSYDNTHSYR